eukprot:4025306-Pleurochrysis_carterae.AAC.1
MRTLILSANSWPVQFSSRNLSFCASSSLSSFNICTPSYIEGYSGSARELLVVCAASVRPLAASMSSGERDGVRVVSHQRLH